MLLIIDGRLYCWQWGFGNLLDAAALMFAGWLSMATQKLGMRDQARSGSLPPQIGGLESFDLGHSLHHRLLAADCEKPKKLLEILLSCHGSFSMVLRVVLWNALDTR